MLRWNSNVLGHAVIGVKFATILRHLDVGRSVDELAKVFQNENYILWYTTNGNRVRVTICLKNEATAKDHVKAWVHALLLAKKVHDGSTSVAYSQPSTKEKMEMLRETLQKLDEFFHEELLGRLKEAGWNLSSSAFETHSGFRIRVYSEGTSARKSHNASSIVEGKKSI